MECDGGPPRWNERTPPRTWRSQTLTLDTAAELPERIKRLRRDLALSQARLAALIGVTELTVLRWEHARARPAAQAWQRVLRLETEAYGREPAPGAEPREQAGGKRRFAASSTSGDVGAGSRRIALPVPLSRFVGRTRECFELAHLIGTARLVSVVGAPGCGKSRLADEVARVLADSFPDGVDRVELATLADHDGLAEGIAASLHLSEQGGMTPLEALATGLREGPRLLLLDNCEHVLRACAEIVMELLDTCPDLHILVTSREPLGVEGEAVRRLTPLSLPPARSEVGSDSRSALEASEASRLFLDRVQRAGAPFELSETNAPAVVAICRRLDGLPLALELAAAATLVLTVEQIAERLDDRFRLLVQRTRTRPAHHQSLRLAIEWSYDMLDGRERVLFDRLSVYAGSFTLASIEAMSADLAGLEGGDPLVLLAELVAKSLVAMEANEREARYHVLESLRAFGRERLVATGAAAAVLQAHAHYYVALAERTTDRLEHEPGEQLLPVLDREQGNIRAALAYCSSEPAEFEGARRLCVACWRWWDVRGRYSEGRHQLARVIALPGGNIYTRARLHHAAGALADRVGDYAVAAEQFELSLALWRELGNRRGEAMMLNLLGLIASEQDDHIEARNLALASLAIAEQLGDADFLTAARANLGVVELNAGNDDAALAILEGCLAIARSTQRQQTVAGLLYNIGIAASRLDRIELAKASFNECLALSQALGYAALIPAALTGAGHIVRREGDCLSALDLLRQALILAQAPALPWTITHGLRGVALIALTWGDFERAATLLGAAEALLRGAVDFRGGKFAAELTAAERTLAAELGAERVSAAWEAGRRLTRGQALNLAAETRAPALSHRTGNAHAHQPAAEGVHFTPREQHILRLIGAGQSNKEIARALGLSSRTVERHITNLYAKIGARGKADAIAFALRADAGR